jgi:signal transduction histidine kinase
MDYNFKMENALEIRKQILLEFSKKSKMSSLGYIATALSFIFISNLYVVPDFVLITLILFILIINLLRFIFSNNLTSVEKLIDFNVKKLSFIIQVNILLWIIFSFYLLMTNHFILNYQILFLFLALVGFALPSSTNFYWNKYLLILSINGFLFPIFGYVVYATYQDGNYNRLFFLILVLINLIYTLAHAKILNKDTVERITQDLQLKKSIIEIDNAHKELAKESLISIQSSRMNSILDFISGISHEVNNPLTIAQVTNSKLIEGDYGPINSEQLEKLNKIRIAIERINKIVSSLKMVANTISTDNFTENNFKLLLNSVLEIYEDKAALNRVKIKINEISDAKILCSGPQVSQIIMNLLDNAIEATIKSEIGKNIYLETEINETKLLFRVINDGPLIPNSSIDKIFLPFFTTKEIGAGPGLGLTLSHSLALANSGTLEYKVHNSKTCFLLTLNKAI